ncbi:MAG: GntR family transcriptional regulator [Actinomycetota bacterium]
MTASSRALEVVRSELSSAFSASDDVHGTSERTFRQLLQAIVTVEYEPGQMLSERELMERTESTRPALRMAVVRLSDLGLLTPLARKGLVVAPLDVLDVSAVYDARMAIETAVVRFAAHRATARQIGALRDLSQSRTDGLEESASSFVGRDLALHLALAAAGRNRYLEDALTRILPLSARLWHRLYRELGSDRRFMFEHHDIIEAIAARDPDGAEGALAMHLQSARDIMASVFLPTTIEVVEAAVRVPATRRPRGNDG